MTYTKTQVKKIARKLTRELKYSSKLRRKQKSIHLLINLKSNNFNPYEFETDTRKHLVNILRHDVRWNGLFKRFLVGTFRHSCLTPGEHEVFENQYNNAYVDDLPF